MGKCQQFWAEVVTHTIAAAVGITLRKSITRVSAAAATVGFFVAVLWL